MDSFEKMMGLIMGMVTACLVALVILMWADWLKYGRLHQVKADVAIEQTK